MTRYARYPPCQRLLEEWQALLLRSTDGPAAFPARHETAEDCASTFHEPDDPKRTTPSLVSLFEVTVDRQPEAWAVSFGGLRIRYRGTRGSSKSAEQPAAGGRHYAAALRGHLAARRPVASGE